MEFSLRRGEMAIVSLLAERQPINPWYRRDRLLNRLRTATQRRVALLEAPSGSGKSVLLRQFGCRVHTVPGPGFSDWDTVSEWLKEAQATPDFVFVAIESSGLIAPDVIAKAAAFIEDHDDVRIILSTRSTEAWPVARWFDQGICSLPLSYTDFRFTDAEAEDFLRTNVVKSNRGVYRLMQLAEGWPVALGLAARLAHDGVQDLVPALWDLLENYVVRNMLGALSESEKRALLLSVALGDLRWNALTGLALAPGVSVGQVVHDLKAKIPWYEVPTVGDTGDRRWRLSKGVSTILSRRIWTDRETFREVYSHAAKISEEETQSFIAFRCYLNLDDLVAAKRVILNESFVPALAVDGALLQRAVSGVTVTNHDPIAIALRGLSEFREVQVGIGKVYMDRALERAGDRLSRSMIAIAYASTLLLMRRTKDAGVALNQAEPCGPEALQLTYYTTKALLAIRLRDDATAMEAWKSADAILQSAHRSITAAWGLVDLSYVATHYGNTAKAEEYFEAAVAIAESYQSQQLLAKALFTMFARFRDTLQDENHTTRRSFAGLGRAVTLAQSSGDRLLEARIVRALLDMCYLYAGKNGIEYWTKKLHELTPILPVTDTDAIYGFAPGLAAAWEGEFVAAASGLRERLDSATFSEDSRLVRMGLYTVMASQVDTRDTLEFVPEIDRLLPSVASPGKRVLVRSLVALAKAASGESYVEDFEKASRDADLSGSNTAKAFVQATQGYAEALVRKRLVSEVNRDLLERYHLGGYSVLFDNLRFRHAKMHVPSGEFAVLRSMQRNRRITNGEIAAEVGAAEGTVKTYVHRLMERFQIERSGGKRRDQEARDELVRVATENGVLEKLPEETL